MSNAQSAEAVQPTQGALDDPTPSAKPFARLHGVPRNARCDAPTAQPSPMGSRSVCSIGMQLTWTFASTACQPFNCRNGLYQRNEETRVVHLRARDLGY
jgi:hypothetical protein